MERVPRYQVAQGHWQPKLTQTEGQPHNRVHLLLSPLDPPLQTIHQQPLLSHWVITVGVMRCH